MRDWTRTLGVGPFFELPPIAPDTYIYRGKDIRPHMRVGLAQAGDVQIEFMQILSPGPSVYHDVFAFGEAGFHHICIMTDAISIAPSALFTLSDASLTISEVSFPAS
jgi:hypothetical protein